ncbi:LapA family protein [Erwinia amylovora]
MKYLLIFLLVLVIFIISITLGAHNDQVVSFNYLLAQGQYRVSTLVATLFAAGFVLGWAICGLFWLRLRVSLANSQRKLKRLQQQLGQAEESVTTSLVPPVKE